MGVAVQRLDDVIAVAPRVVARQVVAAPVSFRKVNGVEPVPRPALAVARRAQQTIDEALVRTRIGVAFKRARLGGRRRQAREAEVNAPDEGAAIRLR